jgi:hypothetical protein
LAPHFRVQSAHPREESGWMTWGPTSKIWLSLTKLCFKQRTEMQVVVACGCRVDATRVSYYNEIVFTTVTVL